MGEILLFGMVARQLGFIVGSVQAAFPDCEARMEMQPGRWQRVRIEFEYESRSFKQHNHDPEKCDLIICWRHNWKGCPPHMQVLALSRMMEQLQGMGIARDRVIHDPPGQAGQGTRSIETAFSVADHWCYSRLPERNSP